MLLFQRDKRYIFEASIAPTRQSVQSCSSSFTDSLSFVVLSLISVPIYPSTTRTPLPLFKYSFTQTQTWSIFNRDALRKYSNTFKRLFSCEIFFSFIVRLHCITKTWISDIIFNATLNSESFNFISY